MRGPVNKSQARIDPLKHLFEWDPMKGINQARGHSHLSFLQIVHTSFFHRQPLIRATRAEVDPRAERNSARTSSVPNAAQLNPKTSD